MAIESVAPGSNVIAFPGAFHPRPRSIWRGVGSLRDIRIAAEENDDQVFHWATGIAWLEAYYDPNAHDEGSYPNGDHSRLLMASNEGELELFDFMDPSTPNPRPGFKIVCEISPNACQMRIANHLRDHLSARRG